MKILVYIYIYILLMEYQGPIKGNSLKLNIRARRVYSDNTVYTK